MRIFWKEKKKKDSTSAKRDVGSKISMSNEEMFISKFCSWSISIKFSFQWTVLWGIPVELFFWMSSSSIDPSSAVGTVNLMKSSVFQKGENELFSFSKKKQTIKEWIPSFTFLSAFNIRVRLTPNLAFSWFLYFAMSKFNVWPLSIIKWKRIIWESVIFFNFLEVVFLQEDKKELSETVYCIDCQSLLLSKSETITQNWIKKWKFRHFFYFYVDFFAQNVDYLKNSLLILQNLFIRTMHFAF